MRGFAAAMCSFLLAGAGGAAGSPRPLQVAVAAGVDTLNPIRAGYQVSQQLLFATCVKLVNYPDSGGAAGLRLRPEAAVALPDVSADGRTYTFRVRAGYRFSPPSGEPVTAATFAHVLVLLANPASRSPGGSYFAGLRATARGNLLRVHTPTAEPDLLRRLATSYACAVPRSTTPSSGDVLPMAGPYYVAAYEPDRSIKLLRNPNYAGPRHPRFAEIDYTIGTLATQALLEIERGAFDWAADGVPPPSAASLLRNFGPGSAAARGHRQRFFVHPLLGFSDLVLNTSKPPFSDPSLRRAVAYAVDREELAGLMGAGGGAAYDHFLPPSMPGASRARVFPLRADLAHAEALMAGRRISATMYTCDQEPCGEIAQAVQGELGRIGISVTIRAFARPVQFQREATRGDPFDIGFEGWGADYPDPLTILDPLFDSRTIHATGNTNLSYFRDAAVDARLASVSSLRGAVRLHAAAALDVAIARLAPAVVFAVLEQRDFFSARIGCQVFQPIYGMDLVRLCAR